MIIDNHVHTFPSQSGPAGYPDAKSYANMNQRGVRIFWGRMVTIHTDPKYIPEPAEKVDFTVSNYGRWTWKKNGEDCWVQRGPAAMSSNEHTPDQMVAHMDLVGVDMAVIQGGYMEPNYGREVYYADCIKKWPDRLLANVDIDYDLSRHDDHLQAEIRKLTHAVEELGFRGLSSHMPKGQPVDDPRCDPLWREVVRLGVPVVFNTGFNSRADYLDEIERLENICRRFPEMNVTDNHIGGNIRAASDPEYVDNPSEFFSLFKLGNFYLEVGYVLAYENRAVWGRDSEYPYPRHEQLVRTIYESFGAGVMVWGSDMPWTQRTCTYRQDLDLIRLHTDSMTEADRKLVTGGNLARIYRIDEKASSSR